MVSFIYSSTVTSVFSMYGWSSKEATLSAFTACLAKFLTNNLKASFLATKSVWQLTSIITPPLLSGVV